MSSEKCPGRNTIMWGADAVLEINCPNCGATLEFFKDEVFRMCKCGTKVENPNADLGISYRKEKNKE
ncbi:MAG: hypothetical protein QXH91_05905 [Candidatus Bathyarchaeia archaeon]